MCTHNYKSAWNSLNPKKPKTFDQKTIISGKLKKNLNWTNDIVEIVKNVDVKDREFLLKQEILQCIKKKKKKNWNA